MLTMREHAMKNIPWANDGLHQDVINDNAQTIGNEISFAKRPDRLGHESHKQATHATQAN